MLKIFTSGKFIKSNITKNYSKKIIYPKYFTTCNTCDTYTICYSHKKCLKNNNNGYDDGDDFHYTKPNVNLHSNQTINHLSLNKQNNDFLSNS
jgi:hypothetical protein